MNDSKLPYQMLTKKLKTIQLTYCPLKTPMVARILIFQISLIKRFILQCFFLSLIKLFFKNVIRPPTLVRRAFFASFSFGLLTPK